MTFRLPAGVVLTLGVLSVMSTPLQAQDRIARSFEQLQVFVSPGDTVLVRDDSGEEVSGRIARLTATELVVLVANTPRVFAATDPLRIRQRRGDSLANGTWIGFASGVGLAVVAVAADGGDYFASPGWVVVAAAIYGAMGAGIGVGVDALVRGRHVIYEQIPNRPPPVAVAPIVGPRRVGAMLAVRF